MTRCPLAFLALLACAAPRPDRADTTVPDERAEGSPTNAAADTLRLALELPVEARAGTTVPMTFRVANVAGRPLELYLRGRTIAFDVELRDARGALIWHRLGDEPVEAIVRLEPLAAGATLTLSAAWNGRTSAGALASPGDYTARALLLTEGEPLATAWVSLRIVGR